MGGETTWRCENFATGDVKMAAKPDHRDKLEEEGYVCEVYHDETWSPAKDDYIMPQP